MQEFTKAGAERHGLTFLILTDPDNKVGEACRLAFRLPDDMIAVYKANGIDLTKFNSDGIVVSAEADPDYTCRPKPEDTLAALRGIQRRYN